MSSSSSKTSATTQNQTHNQDNRLIVEEGGLGATASAGGQITINSTDGGAIDLAKTTMSTFHDSFGDLTKIHERTYDALFDKFDSLVQVGKYVVDSNTELANKAVAAYSPVSSGDTEISKNNTLIMGGLVLIALVYFARNR